MPYNHLKYKLGECNIIMFRDVGYFALIASDANVIGSDYLVSMNLHKLSNAPLKASRFVFTI